MFFAGWLTPPVYSFSAVSNVLCRLANSSRVSFLIVSDVPCRLANSSSVFFFGSLQCSLKRRKKEEEEEQTNKQTNKQINRSKQNKAKQTNSTTRHNGARHRQSWFDLLAFGRNMQNTTETFWKTGNTGTSEIVFSGDGRERSAAGALGVVPTL